MEPAFLVAVAATLLAFGLVSRKAERSVFTPPIVFVLLGVALGEGGLGWLSLGGGAGGDGGGGGAGRGVIHGLAEITLVIVLFTDAARIDLSCLRREGSLPARMLAIGLPLTIAAGTLAAMWVLPGLGVAGAFLLAAILAPTDAALGQSVVSSPLVPVRIRQTLNVESGLNDGIALPVVLIAASLAGAAGAVGTAGATSGDAASWVRFAALQIGLGPLIGIAVGYLGGRLVDRATTAGWVNGPFQRLSALGLAVLAFALAEVVGGNGFIAAFVAGMVMGNATRGACEQLYEFGEAEAQLLTLLVFLVFGAVMLPEAWTHWNARTLLYSVLSLTVVRFLPVALSLLGSGLRPASVAFLGWFGPRGLASILFALLVVERGGLAAEESLLAVVTLTVLLSVFLHGTSAYPLARRYGEYATRERDRAPAEHEPAAEMPVRVRHS